MDEKFCYWLAALVDGEGSIVWRSKNKRAGRYAYSIVIANNHLGLLERAKELCGTGNIYQGNRAYQLRIEKQTEVVRLLKLIVPYLIVKKDKAEVAILNLESQAEWKPAIDPTTGRFITPQ